MDIKTPMSQYWQLWLSGGQIRTIVTPKTLYKVGTRLRKIIIFAEKNRWYDYEERPLQLTLQGKTLNSR